MAFLDAESTCAFFRHSQLLWGTRRRRKEEGGSDQSPVALTLEFLFLLYQAAVLWFLPVPTSSTFF